MLWLPATRLVDWNFVWETKNVHAREIKKKHAPLLDLSLLLLLLLFVPFWVLDSDNCMLAKQLDFSFRHNLYVLSISVFQRFLTLTCAKDYFIHLTGVKTEREKQIQVRNPRVRRKNRRDSWDTMMWLCTEKRWKEKRTQNAMPDWIRNCCYPSTIILFFVLRFVFAFKAEFTKKKNFSSPLYSRIRVRVHFFASLILCSSHCFYAMDDVISLVSLLRWICITRILFISIMSIFVYVTHKFLNAYAELVYCEWFNTILWAMTYET